jgi:3-(3-hydroxy-phenyl)propionate hydroxylase
MAQYDVAVVGLGPTGITLAGLLGRCGLSVLGVDRSREVFPQPRAVGFDHDAMRIFQRMGVAEAIAPCVAPFSEGEYRGVDGQVIRRMKHIDPPYPLTWPPHYTCDQPGLEGVIRGAMTRFPRVDLALGVALEDFTDDGEGVDLTLARDDGNRQTARARYVVACDGGSSPVRRALGLTMQSLEYDEPWIVVDVHVDDPAALARLPRTNVQFCEPARPCTFINCPGNHRRWEFMLLPGEPTEGAVSEERLWSLLSRWLKPGEARIWRSAAYRFHALVADQWRRGRVLLAGDAAHMTPPFLGQGMCQGLRDVGNLAWKLDRVLRGVESDALLDTYGEERRPHEVETTRIAKEFGRIISERDPARARERDAAMLDANGQPRTLMRQELIPGLKAGLVSRRAPLSGVVFPQPVVDTGDGAATLFDEVAGGTWRLVIVRDAASDDLVAQAGELGVEVVQVMRDAVGATRVNATGVAERDGLLDAWFGAHGLTGALVRPDQYVYGAFADVAGALALLAEYAAASQPFAATAAT